MTDDTIIFEARKLGVLSNRQAIFLINWYFDQKDQEFGFREVKSFHEQLKMAVDFYKTTEREWQERILNNQTRFTFEEYFLEKAKGEMIDLPDKFVHYLKEES